jgi:MYXO-CTERM domain-containing protein
MKSSLMVTASVVACSTLAAVASADVTFTLNQSTFLCGQFFAATDYSTGTGFTGTLTGADINVTLNDSFGSVPLTWSSDLTVRVTSTPTYGTTDPLVLNLGTTSGHTTDSKWNWNANGGSSSSTPGTTCFGPSMFVYGPESINLTANPGYTLWIGNGWEGGGPASGATWTGTITLRGVDAVPAPGALALLGVAGLVGARRRRA